MSISIQVREGEIVDVARQGKSLTKQHWNDGVVNGTVQDIQPIQLVRFDPGGSGFVWWVHPRHCWFWMSPADGESGSFTIHFDEYGEIESVSAGEKTVTKRTYDLNEETLEGSLGVIRPAGLIKVEISGSETLGVYDRHGSVWINEGA